MMMDTVLKMSLCSILLWNLKTLAMFVLIVMSHHCLLPGVTCLEEEFSPSAPYIDFVCGHFECYSEKLSASWALIQR